MKNVILIVLLACTQLTFAQHKSIIKGIIINNNTSIAFANVAIMNKDSVIETGMISSDNGSFELKNTGYGDKILEVSYLGYQKKDIPVNINSSVTDLGLIKLQADNVNLKEINVKAYTPTFSIKKGNLVTNVSNSSLSSIGTATDVLDKVPGIFNRGEKITVFGKENPSIYINNRKVYDMDELNNLSSEDIKNIEVIQNPGAKYDTEDQAVILIHTKANDNGFSTRVSEELRQGHYLGDKENLDISYSHKKLDISGSYYHYYRKGKSSTSQDFTIFSDTLWNEHTSCPYTYIFNENKVNGTLNYKINDNHSVGMQYQGAFGKHDLSLTSAADIYANGINYETVNSESDKQDKPVQHLFNVYYEGKINNRLSLNIYGDYVNNQSTTNQVIDEFDLIDTINVNTHKDADYNMYAIKPILTYNLNNKSNIEIGGEFINTTRNGSYTNSYSTSSNSSYKSEESINAGFITYSNKLSETWQLNIGLRYESHYQYYFNKTSNSVEVDNTNHSLFPDFSISHQANKASMSLSVGVRALRPCFGQLNGSNVYINRFLSETGNPSLKQEKIYSANYQISYSFINANLGYSYIQDPISNTVVQDGSSSSSSVNTYKNYDKYQKIETLVSFKYKFGIYEPQLTGTFYKPFFKANYKGEMLNRNTPQTAIQFYNNITLPGVYIFSVNFNYNSDGEYYTATDKENKSIDLRLRKKFMNDKLSVNLYAHDIFNWMERKNVLKVDNYNFTYKAKRETQYTTLKITYLFNNYKSKYKGKHAASDEIDRL